MLAAIITLSLLSLLVATEADPVNSNPEPTSGEPLRPTCKFRREQNERKTDRLAA